MCKIIRTARYFKKRIKRAGNGKVLIMCVLFCTEFLISSPHKLDQRSGSIPSSRLDVGTSTGTGKIGNAGGFTFGLSVSPVCCGPVEPTSSWVIKTGVSCGRQLWRYCRWSEWAAMCWSETAKTAKAIRGRLKALHVAAAMAAVDGMDSALTRWLLLDDAWLEHRWPVPSSSSLGITAP